MRSRVTAAAALAGRLLLAAIFLHEAWSKLAGYSAALAYMQAFGVPGLGRALVIAVIERDIIVVQNLVLLYAVIFVVVNVLVDLSYAWLDPRIRYS